MKLSIILWGIPQAMRTCALVYPEFAERLKERDLIAQFKLADKPEKGRWIQLDNGKITTGKGVHESPDISIIFKNAKIAASFLTPPVDQLERIDAAKNFKIGVEGSDELAVWFMSVLAGMEPLTWKHGTDMGHGVTRYTNGTNGGPIFVYVKDGKGLRVTPMDLDD
jgi:trimethylamine-N-oxide reductase (cytochrome c)